MTKRLSRMQPDQPSWQRPLCKSHSPVDRDTLICSRMANEDVSNDYIPMGLRMLAAVSRQVNSTGHLGQVTDPYSFSVQGEYSPEGQSFVVMAYAAYQDWDAAGREGANGESLETGDGNGAQRLGGVWAGMTAVLAVMGGLLAL